MIQFFHAHCRQDYFSSKACWSGIGINDDSAEFLVPLETGSFGEQMFCGFVSEAEQAPFNHAIPRNLRQYSLPPVVFQHTFKGEHEYVSKVAKTQRDTCALVGAGFECVCDFNGAKIFRKQKH